MWTYYKIIYLFDLGILFLERGVLMGVFEELQARGLIAQITNEEEIKNLVNTGKAIFYLGFDPTADSLHVGHFMALALMRRLQLAGNKPVVLVGGGTGYIGDPSGRTDMRTMMTPETIQHNCDCFKVQMSKFIDFSNDKAIMVNNADWLLQLNYIEMLREVGPHFSVNNMLRSTISEVELVRLLRSKKLEAKENNLAYTSMYISKLGCLRMPFFSVKSLETMGSLD